MHVMMQSCDAYGDVSKSGVWGVLAQKAKEILEDDNKSSPTHNGVVLEKFRTLSFNTIAPPQVHQNIFLYAALQCIYIKLT